MRTLLHHLGAPRLGMALLGLTALYAAIGGVPLGSILPIDPASPYHAPIRETPLVEMSQGEWFAAWPMRLLLTGIAVSTLAATAVRVPRRAAKLGVMLVHLGAAVLGVGAAVYAAGKVEGRVVLESGPQAGAGPPQHVLVRSGPAVLEITHADAQAWSTTLDGLPRFNDYNVAWSKRPLDIRLQPPAHATIETLRIDGFAAHARLADLTEFSRTPLSDNPTPVWRITLRAPAGDLGPVDLVAGPPGAAVHTFHAADQTIAVRHVLRLNDASVPRGPNPGQTTVILAGRAALVLRAGAPPALLDGLEPGGRLDLGAGVHLGLDDHWPDARRRQAPLPLPAGGAPGARGSREDSILHVRVRTHDGAAGDAWLPFTLDATTRPIPLDDGRTLRARYGAVLTPSPAPLALRGFDVETFAGAAGQGAPRDFHIAIDVAGAPAGLSLNNPLIVPEPSWRRWLGDRWTFSLQGWDEAGWREHGAPRFIVLHAGNAPGLSIILAGAGLMGAGAVWTVAVWPIVRRGRRTAARPGSRQ